MKTIRLKDKEFKLFIPEEKILAAIKEVAAKIEKDMAGKNPLFVGVLNGAFMFVADLMKQLNDSYELYFARYKTYIGTNSSGTIQEIMPLNISIEGRTVVLLEDIVDSGYTMKFVKEKMYNEGALDVKVATMLFKPDALKCDLRPDYVAMEIPNDFIVGYGLDYDELGRAYRDIYTIIK